jgi:hypothetical protein
VDADFSDALRWHLEPFRISRAERRSAYIYVWVQDDDAEVRPTLYSYQRDQVIDRKSQSLPGLLNHAVWDIHAYVAEHVRDFLLIHAGAASAPEGALLVPGGTGSGKSTLVAALLQRGFEYLSDDFAAIDPITTKIYPYPKRISLKRPSLRFFPGLEEGLGDRDGALRVGMRERFARPEDLGSGVGGPAAARWLVFQGPDRQGSARLSPMPRAEAMEELVKQAFNLHRYRDRGVVLLSRLVGDAETFRLDGGTPPERAELLADRFLAG